MRSLLDNSAVINHENDVSRANGGQAVRDHKRDPPLEHCVYCRLNELFGLGINGTGRLIHDEDLWVGKDRSGQGNEL